MKLVFKTEQSLHSMLTKVKDPVTKEKQAKVVYQIPCSCSKVYIGETVRKLETRVKEQQIACQKGTHCRRQHRQNMHRRSPPNQVGRCHINRPSQNCQGTTAERNILLQYPPFNRDEGIELPRCCMVALKDTAGGNGRKQLPTSRGTTFCDSA